MGVSFMKRRLTDEQRIESRKNTLKKWNEKAKNYKKEWYEKNKERLSANTKEYYRKNKKTLYEKQKEYVKKNKDKIKANRSIYREKNRQKIRENYIVWVSQNRERIRTVTKEWRKDNPLNSFKARLRSRIYAFFKKNNINKSMKTECMLGIDYELAKKHIENQFEKGMSWENKEEWHIDHIIPLSFGKTEEEMIDLCHYTNLRPMWAKENLKKSNRLQQVQTKLTI
jgi:hypothetical protein